MERYINKYKSKIGDMILASDGENLIGLWFVGQKYECDLVDDYIEKDLALFNKTKKWLDVYFNGEEPDFSLPLTMYGTEFQKQVWNILLNIPYGRTITYGDIAKKIDKKMSAQAVGNAVGHNHISIIIPCHRVVGSNGKLTGYAGGIDKKEYLLKLEKNK